jgi:hypothetical protein
MGTVLLKGQEKVCAVPQLGQDLTFYLWIGLQCTKVQIMSLIQSHPGKEFFHEKLCRL